MAFIIVTLRLGPLVPGGEEKLAGRKRESSPPSSGKPKLSFEKQANLSVSWAPSPTCSLSSLLASCLPSRTQSWEYSFSLPFVYTVHLWGHLHLKILPLLQNENHPIQVDTSNNQHFRVWEKLKAYLAWLSPRPFDGHYGDSTKQLFSFDEELSDLPYLRRKNLSTLAGLRFSRSKNEPWAWLGMNLRYYTCHHWTMQTWRQRDPKGQVQGSKRFYFSYYPENV